MKYLVIANPRGVPARRRACLGWAVETRYGTQAWRSRLSWDDGACSERSEASLRLLQLRFATASLPVMTIR
jgi:hypothetical protein